MILIVDDHVDSCAALASFLKWDDQDARSLHSGVAAINWLAVHLPAALVLDDFMPEMSGLEVLQELRKNARYDTLPILMYSAGDDPDRRARALRLGAVGWITKGAMSWRDVAAKIVSLLPPIAVASESAEEVWDNSRVRDTGARPL